MKKMYIALTAALLVFSGCIKETYPTTYVLADQIGQSESALESILRVQVPRPAGPGSGLPYALDIVEPGFAHVSRKSVPVY